MVLLMVLGRTFSAAAVSHGKVNSPRRFTKQLRDKLISDNGLVRVRCALCLTGRWAALRRLERQLLDNLIKREFAELGRGPWHT